MSARRLLARAGILWSLARDIYLAVGPWRRRFYFVCALSLLPPVLTNAQGFLLVSVADAVMGGGGELPAAFAWLRENLSGGSSAATVLNGMAVLLVTGIINQLLLMVLGTLSVTTSARVVVHLRRTILDNIVHARFGYLAETKAASVSQVMSTDTKQVMPVAQSMVELIGSGFSVAMLIGLLAYISLPLTISTLAFALLLLAAKYVLSRHVRRLAASAVDVTYHLVDCITEIMLGIRQVKLQNRQRQFLDKAHGFAQKSARDEANASLIIKIEPLVQQIATYTFVLGAISIVAVSGWIEMSLAVGFFLVFYRGVGAFNGATTALNLVLSKQPAVQRTMLYLRNAARHHERRGGQPLTGPIQEIAFSGVRFHYRSNEPILDGVDLRARRGEVVAIVGPSGSGKSTIVSLLLGMYEPAHGHVTINGQDISQLDLKSIRNAIGVVSQDVFLFSTTVSESIRGAHISATQEAIEAAAKKADIDQFISGLPQAYDTSIGDRGLALSGGQRQRLFLAQVLLRRTPVLILDEATSALDWESERAIIQHLEEGRSEQITILITHRIHLTRTADRIYLIRQGRICEQGSWGDLMEQRGDFWRAATLGVGDLDTDTSAASQIAGFTA